jgi:hypothetical protein
MQNVIVLIFSERPDAVFLQEVIPMTFELIRDQLSDYELHSGSSEECNGYFVVILTRRDTFKVEHSQILPLTNSKMGRNVLIVQVRTRDIVLERHMFVLL